jgi:hypothetical protein
MKLMVGLPSATGSNVCPLTASLLELQTACLTRDIQFTPPAIGMSAQLPGIRDAIVQEFVRGGADLLLFCDVDQSFEPEDVFALLSPISKGLADVCGAAIGLKSYSPERIRVACLQYQSDIFRAAVSGTNVIPLPGAGMLLLEKNLYLPAKVGTGLMLLTRHAVALASRAATKHYETYDSATGDPQLAVPQLFEGLSEDLSFCDKVLAAGGKVLAHLNSEALHWGTAAFKNNAIELLKEKGHLKAK